MNTLSIAGTMPTVKIASARPAHPSMPPSNDDTARAVDTTTHIRVCTTVRVAFSGVGGGSVNTALLSLTMLLDTLWELWLK